MKWTVLGSGGCAVIPKPACRCRVCRQARRLGAPYSRAGPAAFLHDINLLIDTTAEAAGLLNRAAVARVDNLMFSHLDPDHVEGFRVVEQIALDFRSWKAYPDKQIRLLLPEELADRLPDVSSQYGPMAEYFVKRGFIRVETFAGNVSVGGVDISAIPVDRGSQLAFIYVFEAGGRRAVYAPCDIKPFPEARPEVKNADVLFIQPGIFEKGLRHGFKFPADHISRTTLYTFEETLALAQRLAAKKVVFVHLEEYWHRSYDDYRKLQRRHQGIRFAYDGMRLVV